MINLRPINIQTFNFTWLISLHIWNLKPCLLHVAFANYDFIYVAANISDFSMCEKKSRNNILQ